MRLISFAATTQQVRDRTKTVTRRAGWTHLTPGTRLLAVAKARGVRVEDRETLAVIEVVSARREPVQAITEEDCEREGFPGWAPARFITLYCHLNQCSPMADCTRIEFRYYGVRPCDDGWEGWVVYDLTTDENMGDEKGEIVYARREDAERVATAGVGQEPDGPEMPLCPGSPEDQAGCACSTCFECPQWAGDGYDEAPDAP